MHYDLKFVVGMLPSLLDGLGNTFLLVFFASLVGIVLGLLVCFGRLYVDGPWNWLCRIYVTVARGIPEIVVMFWVYYCCPLVFDVRPSSFVSALIAMSLYSGAMLAEVFRAGIAAVPQGQHQAASALGMPSFWLWWDIIGPQALRATVPALLGVLSLLVKISGIASAIGFGELVYTASIIGGQTFRYFELYSAIGVMYFLAIFALSIAARHFESRFRKAAA